MRTFSLNSREFYEAVCEPLEPHVWAGGLPREPRWPRPTEGVWVSAENDEAASTAAREWIGPVGTGRIDAGG